MTEEKITSLLQGYSLDDLYQLKAILERKVEEQRAKQTQVRKFGFRASLKELADSSGLDIASLMKDAAQWQKR
ncbi:hypothetical protein QCD60_05365 [Pokkaliibacter sp. MBI-7]|uniref:Uncharacterized protein n=1 Tax=Proteobacteria bacterium 228 TaxID=2083153 RepID=A0A2S5KLY7_9PROT|nr:MULTISPECIES: hypothetical protein [Pokkaliibacter]MDH2431982.1 hypothetical protein [Pokkaliibacter sp. MBI-7]PPC75844.1 hypothetical protein C4K68_18300 [Pokkaliibacter plantistimulans]